MVKLVSCLDFENAFEEVENSYFSRLYFNYSGSKLYIFLKDETKDFYQRIRPPYVKKKLAQALDNAGYCGRFSIDQYTYFLRNKSRCLPENVYPYANYAGWTLEKLFKEKKTFFLNLAYTHVHWGLDYHEWKNKAYVMLEEVRGKCKHEKVYFDRYIGREKHHRCVHCYKHIYEPYRIQLNSEVVDKPVEFNKVKFK